MKWHLVSYQGHQKHETCNWIFFLFCFLGPCQETGGERGPSPGTGTISLPGPSLVLEGINTLPYRPVGVEHTAIFCGTITIKILSGYNHKLGVFFLWWNNTKLCIIVKVKESVSTHKKHGRTCSDPMKPKLSILCCRKVAVGKINITQLWPHDSHGDVWCCQHYSVWRLFFIRDWKTG